MTEPVGTSIVNQAFERNCSVRRTVDIVLDSWSFLILREAFFGVKRFDTFQSRLEIPRQTLSIRLAKLVENDVLSKGKRSGERGSRYFLTPCGKDLFPTMLSLMEFGDKWLAGDLVPPLRLYHTQCNQLCHPTTSCSACLEPVDAHQVMHRDGPSAGYSAVLPKTSTRRASDPKVLQRVRPCSVARTLSIIGDRWSFLILREGWFGVRRFDEMRENLGIATNILSDRLNRLVDSNIFDRVPYNGSVERYEYRFTKNGLDLYKPMITMMAWGDRWLYEGKAPLRLRHRTCGQDFTPQVLCDKCKQPIVVTDTDYQLEYELDA